MPLDPLYTARTEHNERLLGTFNPLSDTEFLDWAVVVAFYVALRYVDAFFSPERPVNHEERNGWVARNSRTSRIYNAYRELYQRARDARYELVEFTANEVESLIANRLSLVKSHMLRQ